MLKQVGIGVLAVAVAGLVALAYTHVEGKASASTAPLPAFTASALPSPTPTAAPIVAVIGDGYSSGSSMNSGPQTLWTTKVAKDLGVQVQQLAVIDTGYLTSNSTSSSPSTMADRASKVDKNASVVVFFGGSSDVGIDTATLESTALAAFTTAKKRAPNAKLIVIGPARTGSVAPSTVRADRDAIHAAATAAHATWIDPIADGWFPSGSSLIGSDGQYPTDAGEAELARRIEPALRKALAGK